jgi:hypothetical protein
MRDMRRSDAPGLREVGILRFALAGARDFAQNDNTLRIEMFDSISALP